MIPFVSLFFGVFVLDFATKVLVRARMPLGQEISILPFFSLTHLTNTGIAFGLFQDRNPYFIVIGGAVMVGLLFFAVRLWREDPFSGGVVAMVLGGALGNMLDRIRHGEVTDFLDFHIGRFHWPVFNVADSAICVGVGLLLWKSLRKPT